MDVKDLVKIGGIFLAGFILGYLFRSRYAFHHHPPYFSEAVITRYRHGRKVWEEKQLSLFFQKLKE